MRVAVTGAAGFIGSAVAARLHTDEHHVVPIDKRWGGDILDGVNLAGCDAVIHTAGLLGTSELFDDVDAAIDVNVKGTVRVLEAARVVDATYVGITMPAVFPSVYTATTIARQRLAEAFGHAYGLAVTHVRAFNAYGEGQKVGWPQKIIPTFADRSWRGEPMPVWGDGTQTVDLVHVDDVAANLVGAVTHFRCDHDLDLCHYGAGQVYDAGSGQETQVLTVARMVGEITGSTLVEFLPMRVGETPDTRICASEFGPFAPDRFDPERFARVVESYQPVKVAAA